MVDKNLFLHDLSVVAILKCEGPYLKEWLDYHLLAGVDHFYLYDNDSPDNQAEVAKPYVEAGLVDYIPFPGKVMQYIACNDAIKRFKFQTRYMAFIDGDEFVYPKVDGGGIINLVDEILSRNPNAAGLGINWQIYGSNGQEKADYSRGVLERFTRRAPSDWVVPLQENFLPGNLVSPLQKNISRPGGNTHIKTIGNARFMNCIVNIHFPFYFEGLHSVNENGVAIYSYFNNPVTVEKIALNHYYSKSREEFYSKRERGRSDTASKYTEEWFDMYDRNEEFDDGILKYREERAKIYKQPDKSHANERLLTALMKNLLPTLKPDTPPEFYRGKMETFLTCRAVAEYLKTKLSDDAPARFFEEAALVAILKSFAGMTFADARLFLRELPNLLSLPYPVVKDLRTAALNIIRQLMNTMHLNAMWKDYVELDYLKDILKIGG